MALQFKPKRTTTSGNVPDTTNLVPGEMAVNLADKKLYIRDTSNNVLELTTRTLSALDNVSFSGLSNDQVLQYDSATNSWKNASLASAWTNGSGFIYNTSTVGIGTATPDTSYKLDVNGTVNCSSLFVNGTAVSGQAIPFNVTASLITTDYTLPEHYRGTTEGPISIDTGVTVSIFTGSTLEIT
jgi:hypothetical protein